MKKHIIFLLFIFLFDCGRWKITKLKSDHIYTINPGESPGNIMLNYDKDNILDISFKIEIYSNNLYIIDNILKRVQVLDKNCDPVLSIGEKKPAVNERTEGKFSKFQFSIIDAVIVDSNGNIYIQNSFASSKKNNNQTSDSDFGFLPSYILVFDEKGTLLYTLGKTGSPDIPFNSIESLRIDREDRLFVITRSYDMWSVSRFNNKRRDFNINFSETDFKDVDGENIYAGKIEKIIPFQSGNDLLISAAYYDAANFLYRKIYNYSLHNQRITNTAFVISDPKNELFALVDDKHIYLWDIDEKNIRFMIYNLNGDIINNISIKFPGRMNLFDEILIDNAGHFYSYHVIKKGVEVLEWR